MARADELTPYWRRKALCAAYGAHVVEWRSWRYREMVAACRVRDEARARWYAEQHVIDAARAAEWREAISELRADLATLGKPRAQRWPAYPGEWVGVVTEHKRLCDDGKKPGAIVRVMGDFGDLWIE